MTAVKWPSSSPSLLVVTTLILRSGLVVAAVGSALTHAALKGEPKGGWLTFAILSEVQLEDDELERASTSPLGDECMGAGRVGGGLGNSDRVGSATRLVRF